MENMFELLATVPAVQDEAGAEILRVAEGRVEFQEVSGAAVAVAVKLLLSTAIAPVMQYRAV